MKNEPSMDLKIPPYKNSKLRKECDEYIIKNDE